MADGKGLTFAEYRNFKILERDLLMRGRREGDGGDGSRFASYPGALVVCLLDDLPSGERCRAAVLRRGKITSRQFIDLLGTPAEDDTWSLSWAPDVDDPDEVETIENLSATLTADELREALESLPSIAAGDVHVQLGRHNRIFRNTPTDVVSLTRWLVEFRGKYQGREVSLLEPTIASGGASGAAFATSVETYLYDTGTTEEIYAPIPVGSPTPLRRGAIGVVVWSEGNGWTLVAIEPRQINLLDAEGYY